VGGTSWATLTSVNNAAWFAYFALASYWTALVPAASATLLAGTLASMLARRGQATARPAVLTGSWVALLFAGFVVAGRTGLGTLLTAAFILQVAPSLWTAYRTTPAHPGRHRSHRQRPHARPDPPHTATSPSALRHPPTPGHFRLGPARPALPRRHPAPA
jgi:hypothetical protein